MIADEHNFYKTISAPGVLLVALADTGRNLISKNTKGFRDETRARGFPC